MFFVLIFVSISFNHHSISFNCSVDSITMACQRGRDQLPRTTGQCHPHWTFFSWFPGPSQIHFKKKSVLQKSKALEFHVWQSGSSSKKTFQPPSETPVHGAKETTGTTTVASGLASSRVVPSTASVPCRGHSAKETTANRRSCGSGGSRVGGSRVGSSRVVGHHHRTRATADDDDPWARTSGTASFHIGHRRWSHLVRI